jgi:hypothetical protein
MTKRRDGTRVARWVTERVAEIAPAGLGRWAPAWELVEGPSLDFLDALGTWEETGAPEDMEEARRTAAGVVAAWREAARRWEEAGRPTTTTRPEPEPVEAGR